MLNPLVVIIQKYKDHIREHSLDDELYKWELLGEFRGRPNVDESNFYEEIKSIKFHNLIYHNGIAVSRHLAKERMESYRECFKKLFDEDIPLIDRVRYFNEETLKIYRELVPDEKLSHHQDERTLATFLTYHNPDKYTLYKSSFYEKYCELIGLKNKIKNEKYVHYLDLVEDFIEEYIKPDQELIDLFQNALPANVYQDPNFKILAQDILYTSLDKKRGEEKSFWRIGTSDGKISYWDIMREHNKICIGWPELGDLNETESTDKKKIDELLKNEGYYVDNNSLRSRKAGEIFNFYSNIDIGDIVLAQDGSSVLGIGIVTDVYIFDEKEGFPHQRDVKWKVENPDMINKEGLQTTVYEISDLNTVRKIEELLNKDVQIMNELINLLNYKKQVILQGPPGTGKTYTAKNIAEQMISDTVTEDKKKQKENLEKSEQFRLVQFHPSYSYEDFVRGITAISKGGQIEYETENKVLAKFAKKAKGDQDNNYILIIDEINRANLPSVLGELIYALEYREEKVESMYAVDKDAAIVIPDNLYIIGTMNTADRSVGHIDYAIKRRFAFVNVLPNEEVIENEKAKELFRIVSALFEKEYLASDFDKREVQLGHSYFLVKDEQELKMRLDYEILPILHEYVKDGLLLETAKEYIDKNIANFV